MSDSSTDDEALHGGAGGIDNSDHSSSAGQASDESSSQGAQSAGSPAAEPTKDDNKPATIADAVRAALEGGKEQSSGSGDGEGKAGSESDPEGESQEGDDDDLGELTEEELNSYKDKTRRRFIKLNSENKSLKERLETAEPEAEVYRQINKFVTDANLSKEDVNTGFNIMKLCRSTRREDHIKAYEAMMPMVNTLAQIIGVALPKDLQDQVAAGQLTPERANEISQLRATARASDAERKANEDRMARDKQAEEERQIAALTDDVSKAVSTWESTWKAKDPDYPLKQRRVMEAIELELTKEVMLATQGKPNRVPKSAAEAVKMAEDVKKRVDKEMQRLIPKKQPVTHIPGTGNTNNSKPAPTSSREAIFQALGVS